MSRSSAIGWARKRRAYRIVGRCTRCGQPAEGPHVLCDGCRAKSRPRASWSSRATMP